MKKILSKLFLATITASALVTTISAKRLKRTSIPVTKNTKKMFTSAKNLKNATTPEEKAQAVTNLATTIKQDRYTQLTVKKADIIKEINKLEAEIAEKGGYISYFDNDETRKAKAKKANLEKILEVIQEELGEIAESQPTTVTKLKNWAIYTLVAAVGLTLVDQLIMGGTGRAAVMAGASTTGSTITSKLKSAWEYVPSFSSTIPSNETTLAAANMAWDIVKAAGISVITQKVANQMMQLLEDPNTDPAEKNEIRKTLEEWETEKAEEIK